MEKQAKRKTKYNSTLRKEILEELCKLDTDAEECYKIVCEHFKKEPEKITLWFYTENPLLGYVAPIFMIHIKRSKRLLQFIKACKEGYFP